MPKSDPEVIDFIVGHLREESPELIDRIPERGLREMVAGGLARARTHGLQSLGDLTAFVSIMFEIAPNFDEHPLIRHVLRSEQVPAEERLGRLFRPELNDAWEAAAQNYDPEAWFPELKGRGDDGGTA